MTTPAAPGFLARCSVQSRESLPASLLNENIKSRATPLSAMGSCIGLAEGVSPDSVGITSPGLEGQSRGCVCDPDCDVTAQFTFLTAG